jgi:carboxylesterase type B
MSITTLLAFARARGLFARAITPSGAAQAATGPADAALVTSGLRLALGLEATAASLAGVAWPTLIEAQATPGTRLPRSATWLVSARASPRARSLHPGHRRRPDRGNIRWRRSPRRQARMFP